MSFCCLAEEPTAYPGRHLAQSFLRLVNLPTYRLHRLNRCGYTLWRQVAQILFALDNLYRRTPQERRRRLFFGGRAPPASERDEY